jgi:hypothetical protein
MTIAIRTEAGSISHGTHRSEDLIAAFSSELRALHSEHDIVAEAEAVLLLHGLGWDVMDSDAAMELTHALMDELEHHAGPGLYFGASEGDGSDFGFWPVADED